MRPSYQQQTQIQKIVGLTAKGKCTTTMLLREILNTSDETPDTINQLAQAIVNSNLYLRNVGMRIKFSPKPTPGHWYLTINQAKKEGVTDYQIQLLILVFALAFDNDKGVTTLEEIMTVGERLGRTKHLIQADLNNLKTHGYLKSDKERFYQLTPLFFTEIDVPALLSEISRSD